MTALKCVQRRKMAALILMKKYQENTMNALKWV
jgi:hypothetical protein